jgi:hypothetical protein
MKLKYFNPIKLTRSLVQKFSPEKPMSRIERDPDYWKKHPYGTFKTKEEMDTYNSNYQKQREEDEANHKRYWETRGKQNREAFNKRMEEVENTPVFYRY